MARVMPSDSHVVNRNLAVVDDMRGNYLRGCVVSEPVCHEGLHQ